MKVALVGLGYWGPKLLRNLVSIVGPTSVVAVDRAMNRLAAASAEHPGVHFLESFEEALEDDDVEAVIVATPVKTHAALASRALKSGRHVLVEKPLAGSVEDARELVGLASECDRTLMVGHTFLFSPRIERIAEYVHTGALGRIHYAASSRLALGPYRSDVSAIWDLAPHDFSILFHLLGEFPELVSTTGRCLTRQGYLDVAFINLTFPSGVVASVTVSWLAPKKIRNTIIVGEQKMLVYDDTDPDEPIRLHDKGFVFPESADFGENQLTFRSGDTVAPNVAASEPISLQLRHFFDCIKENGGPCRSDGVFGLRVVEALEAADRSWHEEGRPTEVEHSHIKSLVG